MKDILNNRKPEVREYSSISDYRAVIQEAYDHMSYWFPKQVEGRPPDGTYYRVAASDFWVNGDGGHSDLAKKWNIELPGDFLEFSSLFKTYAVIGRRAVRILNAKDVEEITLGLRDGEDVSPDDPYELYRFAQVIGQPWHFMFRYNDDGSFRDIAFASYSDSDEWEILGENEAHYFSDRSFSEWLTRMIETDCVPLRPNFLDKFAENTQRLA